MRTWIPLVIFLTAIAGPVVVAAYVLFGVTINADASSMAFNAADPATIALCVLVGVMISFVLAAILTSIILRLRRPKAKPVDPRPVHSALNRQHVDAADTTPEYVVR